MKLRDYQIEMVDAVMDHLLNQEGNPVVAPTRIMKTNEQRIAIAEACGWKLQNVENLSVGEVLAYGRRWWRHAGDKTISTLSNLPDYLNDLNAMHEAEKVLSHEQKLKYYHHICGSVRRENGQSDHETIYVPLHTTHATAPQRAEAFLKTLHLWTE